jgi:hypothetical protein
LARTIYIRCIYGIFGREIARYTVIYGVYIRFWPTLILHVNDLPRSPSGPFVSALAPATLKDMSGAFEVLPTDSVDLRLLRPLLLLASSTAGDTAISNAAIGLLQQKGVLELGKNTAS